MSKKLIIYIVGFLIISIAGNAILFSSWRNQRASRIRMSENYYSSKDSMINIYSLTLSEIKESKKRGDDIYLTKIDSLQRENNIKNRHLNEATIVIADYKSKASYIIPLKGDTVYLPGEIVEISKPESDSLPKIQPFEPFDNGCVFFSAGLDSLMRLRVANVGYRDEFVVVDFTKRKKISWLFGLRLGRKETNIIAEGKCATVRITKYKRVRK